MSIDGSLVLIATFIELSFISWFTEVIDATSNMRPILAFISPLLATTALAVNVTKYAVKEPPLTTDWTYKVGTNPWPEYPRPQLQRVDWQNLNGIWNYQNASSLNATAVPPFGQTLQNEVMVPSCLESGLSGTYASGFRSVHTLIENRHPGRVYTLFVVCNIFYRAIFVVGTTSFVEFWSSRL